MKTLYIILFFTAFLCVSPLSSQVKKFFFVNDIADVEYVTVNFCVDNDAKISKVTIVSEKTTYKNVDVIQQLKEYLLSIQYYPNSKLKNNCYDSTFTFINSKYKSWKMPEGKCVKARKFLKGEFQYKNVLYLETKIKRGKRIQRELGKKSKQIYYIKWQSNCTYKLIYKKMTEERLKNLIGKAINVEIIDILPDNKYIYKSSTNFNERVIYGVIKKIK